MKTTVRNMMMSLVLMGGMIMAVPASAQFSSSRQRATTARSASGTPQARASEARQSRASEARQSRASEVRQSRASEVRQSRASEVRQSQGSMRTRSSEARASQPQMQRTGPATQVHSQSLDRSSAIRTERGTVRTDRGTRSGNDGGIGRTRNNDNTRSTVTNGRTRPSAQMGDARSTTRTVTPSNLDDNKGNRGGMGNNRDGNNDRNGRGGNNGRNRHDNGNGRYDNDRGHNNHGYGPSDRGGHSRPYNYDSHPHRDHFSYAHRHHNWSRPLPPPPRPYRPAPLRYYRPALPAHYRPYYGAPVIDRILGITFGTYYDVSLDYLYTNGYYIDGYQDNIIYLREVRMLNLLWPDVMFCYDNGRLANAQFVYTTTYRDHSRYNRIYHDLSAVYGPPISVESGMATWFGGNTTGYVTLSMGTDYGRFYTTLSIGY
ncbi:MAG: hypothetical protein IJ724_05755 [Muribaculaceae bacterium]|nr:hypothetical protein [Muribaculaceae bacterium]